MQSEEEERDIEGEVAVLTIDGEKMQYAGCRLCAICGRRLLLLLGAESLRKRQN